MSVLQSYQTEGDAPFPWSVGELAVFCFFFLGPVFCIFAWTQTALRLSRRGHDSGREAAAGTFLGESAAQALKSGV